MHLLQHLSISVLKPQPRTLPLLRRGLITRALLELPVAVGAIVIVIVIAIAIVLVLAPVPVIVIVLTNPARIGLVSPWALRCICKVSSRNEVIMMLDHMSHVVHDVVIYFRGCMNKIARVENDC